MNKQPQNNAKENLAYYQKYLTLLTLFLFAICCLFAWNSYKTIVSFMTNGFENTVNTLAIITSYSLPVFCFFVFFFNSFIKPNKKVTRWIYSCFVLAFALVNIALIAINYQSLNANATEGHFVNFNTIGLSYPVDMLVVNCLLVLVQAFNIFVLIKPNSKYAFVKDAFASYGFFKFNLVSKIFVTILALITMVFIGDFLNSFSAIGNAAYDGKYIFLILMIFVIPLMNFVYFLTTPKVRSISKKTNLIIHSCVMGVNVLFAILLIAFTFGFPDFVVGVGKPLFPLDYTISIPVGPYLILIIIVVSTIIQTINLVKLITKNKETE